MRITTIINGKGGVGKTTTAHSLATGLNKNGYKALAIDYDPQGNLSLAFGADTERSPTMFHIMDGQIGLNDEGMIQHVSQGDIIVGNASLGKIESMYSGENQVEGLYALRDILEAIQGDYTHVIIDNQPLIGGLLTRQALIASSDVVIPATADSFTMQGLANLLKALDSITKRINPTLRISGILLTRHNPRTTLAAHMSEGLSEWAKKLNTKVFATHIREGIAVREAQAKSQSIFDYAKYSNPALDYKAFLDEYLEGV